MQNISSLSLSSSLNPYPIYQGFFFMNGISRVTLWVILLHSSLYGDKFSATQQRIWRMVKYQLKMFSPKYPPIFDAFDILSFDKISYPCISVFVGCHWVGEQYLDPCSSHQIFIVSVGASNGCWSKVSLCSWKFFFD